MIDEDEIKKVISVLSDEVSDMPKNWNRRFKYNKEKIKTGNVFELAEVVRNLALREMEKGLSTGEKQMYTRAKKILASEFMYALDKDEEGAEEYLDGLLEERFEASVAAAAARLIRRGGGPGDTGPARYRADRGRRIRVKARCRRPEGAGSPVGRPMYEWSLEACPGGDSDRPDRDCRAARQERRRSARGEEPIPGRRRGDPLALGRGRSGGGRHGTRAGSRCGPAAGHPGADR